jgi:DNA-binding CsgD family transcriptional regulator
MSKHAKITADIRAQVMRLRGQGTTQQGIADQLGISRSSVEAVLRSGGKPTPTFVARRQRLQRIQELRSRGLSYDEIGAKVGINGGTVGYYLTKTAKNPKYRSTAVNGGPARQTHTRRHIDPIVLGAETVAQVDENRMRSILDFVWLNLPYDDKLKAIEAVSNKD